MFKVYNYASMFAKIESSWREKKRKQSFMNKISAMDNININPNIKFEIVAVHTGDVAVENENYNILFHLLCI